MPLPTPNNDESQDDFISRCMSNETMLEEYPDDDQRHAVCQTQWDDKDENSAQPTVERRVTCEDIEFRVERDKDNKPTFLQGYAAVFNKDSVNLGWFVERIKPGAFGNALKDSDVRALVNHDSNLVLGRSTAGTLNLTENTKGLKFNIKLPDTQAARDVAESIDRGDITGCSFAFTTKSEQWDENEDKPDLRTILEVQELFDVGPVTYPAYPDTTVAVRSREVWQEKRDVEIEGENRETQPETKPDEPLTMAEMKQQLADTDEQLEQEKELAVKRIIEKNQAVIKAEEQDKAKDSSEK